MIRSDRTCRRWPPRRGSDAPASKAAERSRRLRVAAGLGSLKQANPRGHRPHFMAVVTSKGFVAARCVAEKRTLKLESKQRTGLLWHRKCSGILVISKLFLALLWSSLLVTAAPSSVLGLDYSQWLPDRFRAIATDGSGAIYLLRAEATPGVNGLRSSVSKLSADGRSILWTNRLPTEVSRMAIDSSGGVYVTPIRGDGAVTVAKLDATGSGIAWTSPTLIPPPQFEFPLLAVDAKGRTYISVGAKLVRLSADGSAIEYSVTSAGTIYSIAADATGAAFATTDRLLTRFAPDGSVGFQASLPTASDQHVALDANGNAVVNTGGGLARFDANGGMISSFAFPAGSAGLLQTSFVLDKAGNAYIAGTARSAYYPVKNTLAPCGTQFLSVIAPDGTVLQSTYLPGADSFGSPSPVSFGLNGNVLLVLEASQSFVPSRPSPLTGGPAPATPFLLSLSPTVTADVFPLACISNAASHTPGPITAGEVLELSGSGLGPQNGAQPDATLQTRYPTRVSEVQVTFDGTPAPILWAQEGQVNVVAPWSLNATGNTQVCITYREVALKCLSWPTAGLAPGVFTNYSTNSFAVALNQDGSVNSASNPAASGSIVSVFANGLGSIEPHQADGTLINFPLPNNVLQATVQALIPDPNSPRGLGTIEVPAEVTYSGPAPFRVAGVSQVNFRLNTNIGATYRVGVAGGFSQVFRIFVAAQ